MKAAFTPKYGPASVVELRDVPMPAVGPHGVRVQVRAAALTEGDRRVRSADFPGASAVLGRLAMGLFGPRQPIGGGMFAGRVVEVGADVTDYAVGDDVFGSTGHGAFAEFLVVADDSSIAKLPSNLSYDEAAAVPYGAGTAWVFLRDLADVQPGEKVLVLGASGGVGRFAVQLAKHLGAEVTGVASGAHAELVRELGADHFIDYKRTDFTQNGQRYDVIFDIADATSFGASKGSLTPTGRYLTLYISLRVLAEAAWTSLRRGKRAKFAIAMPDRERIEHLRGLMEAGVLTPVIAERWPLEQIVQAHRAVETSRTAGAVVVTDLGSEALRAVG